MSIFPSIPRSQLLAVMCCINDPANLGVHNFTRAHSSTVFLDVHDEQFSSSDWNADGISHLCTFVDASELELVPACSTLSVPSSTLSAIFFLLPYVKRGWNFSGFDKSGDKQESVPLYSLQHKLSRPPRKRATNASRCISSTFVEIAAKCNVEKLKPTCNKEWSLLDKGFTLFG